MVSAKKKKKEKKLCYNCRIKLPSTLKFLLRGCWWPLTLLLLVSRASQKPFATEELPEALFKQIGLSGVAFQASYLYIYLLFFASVL